MEDEMWKNKSLSPSPPSQNPNQLAAAATTSCSIISTALSLNSSQFIASQECYSSDNNDGANGGDYCNGIGSAASFFSSSYLSNASPLVGVGAGGRRVLEQEMCEGRGPLWTGTDRRKKRMIKNRESAARSRLRKQAYLSELEKEVQHLLKENTELREQYEELKGTMASQEPVKRTLHRVLSAPF